MIFQTIALIIGLNIFPSQFNKIDTLPPNNDIDTPSPNTVRNSISLKDSLYIVKINNHSFKTTSAKVLKESIRVNLNGIKKDTLYIFLNHHYDEIFYRLSKMLREYRITKKAFVLTYDYFRLPYPNQR